MAFDFSDVKRRFSASRKIHPEVVEALIAEHEAALSILREIARRERDRSNACPICGPLRSPGQGHASACRLGRLLDLD